MDRGARFKRLSMGFFSSLALECGFGKEFASASVLDDLRFLKREISGSQRRTERERKKESKYNIYSKLFNI